jgi:hypothetical protein
LALAGVDNARFGEMAKHNLKSQLENLEIELLKTEIRLLKAEVKLLKIESFKQQLWNMGLAFFLLVAVVSFLLALVGLLDRPSELRIPLMPIPSGG